MECMYLIWGVGYISVGPFGDLEIRCLKIGLAAWSRYRRTSIQIVRVNDIYKG